MAFAGSDLPSVKLVGQCTSAIDVSRLVGHFGLRIEGVYILGLYVLITC